MLEIALKLLEEITSHGFKAYIVGGFVRDYILGIDSNDIDITTSATPKDIKEIFEEACLPNEDYGSVTVIKKGIRFEITTFRKEIGYVDNRRPVEVKYIDDLYQDLLRRDFTINTICMDEAGEIVDLLDGKKDLEAGVIRTVGVAKERFFEDALRILRAIRFATILDFKLDREVILAIEDNKYLLSNLSYNRKKAELDKIFASSNASKGIELLLGLGLDKELELSNLGKVKCANNPVGIWAVLAVLDKYPFSSNEREVITSVQAALECNNLDPYALYTHGLYANSVAGEINGFDIKNVAEAYGKLVIQGKRDLALTSKDIMECLNREPGSYIKDIYDDVIREVLYRRIPNEHDVIIDYIKNKYR